MSDHNIKPLEPKDWAKVIIILIVTFGLFFFVGMLLNSILGGAL